MELGLKGKVALVTGGSMGIGKAVVLELAEEGALVTTCARRREPLEEVREEAERKGLGLRVFQADCGEEKDVEALVKAVLDAHGRIDILVNSLGGAPAGGVEALTEETWRDALIRGKLMGQIRCSSKVFPHMKRQRYGRIVNIVGTHWKQPHAWVIAASVVNAGVVAFTKGLSLEGAPHNVLINVVNPGAIATERIRYLKERGGRDIHEEIPLGREGTPEEISGLVVYFASERASYVSGAHVDVDGGHMRCI